MNMQKAKLLFYLFFMLIFAACSNNQNTAEGEQTTEGTEQLASEGTEKEKTVDDSNKAKKMQESKSVTTMTPSQKPTGKRAGFRIKDDSGKIFSGEFAYMADAAYFINCSTGNRYSVLMQEAFPELEKAYLNLVKDEAGKRVYVVIEGELNRKANGEKEFMKGSLSVSGVVSLSDQANCETVVSKLGGMYTSGENGGTFEDCRSGQTYVVQNSGAYEALEKAYLDAVSGPGASAYVELTGFRKSVESEAGGADQTGLVVTRVIGFDTSYSCN